MNTPKPNDSQINPPVSEASTIPLESYGMVSPDAVAMSSMGAENDNVLPMSFDSAGALLRQRVLDPPAHPGILASLDRFKVERVLGMGGMGIVVQARHPVTNAVCAIKLVRPEFVGDPNVVHRFLIEARHMHNLSHPNIVRVMEVSDRERGPYYVMPFYPSTLAQLIQPGMPLERARIIDLGRQIAEAVAYAHAHGVIHRDLKPGNVLLDKEDHAYVSDFGLLRTVFNDSIVNAGGSHCEGTASYMSPAVAAGEAEDTRCDIYAVGAMLYEMLTGSPPYVGPSPIVVQNVISGPPRSIREMNPKADAKLVKIAEGAMARSLRDRYASAADVVTDLKRVAAGRDPLGPRGAIHGNRWILVGIVVSIVAVGSAAAMLLKNSPSTNPVQADARSTAPADPLTPTPAPAPMPWAVMPQPNAPVGPFASLSTAKFDHLNDGELARYFGNTESVNAVRFTPDQLHFVCTSTDRTARLVEISSGKTIWTYRVSGYDPALTDVAYSPDGKSVLIAEFIGDAVLLDMATGAVKQRFLGHRTSVASVAFSPDGQLAVTGSGHWEANHPPDFTVRIWDVGTGAEIHRIGENVFKSTVGQIVVSPDGKLLLTGGADQVFRLWRFRSGELLYESPKLGDRTQNVAFTRDGQQIFTCNWLGQVRFWDAATHKCTATFNTSNRNVEFAKLSPNADRFAQGDIEGNVTIFEARTGRILGRFGGMGHVSDCSWSNDGSHLLVCGWDKTVRLWAVPQ